MTAREFHAVNSAVHEQYRDNMTGNLLCKLDYTEEGLEDFFEDIEKYHEIEHREVVGIFPYGEKGIGCFLF